MFRPNDRITVTAVTRARIVILGGAAIDGPRHIWWNFVSSSQERINQAKADWKHGPLCPGSRRHHRVHSTSGQLIELAASAN